jgi:hypothetical protein
LLESEDPVELPPAEIEDAAVLVQFDQFKPYIPELLEALARRNSGRAGSGDGRRLNVCDSRSNANVLGQALARSRHRVNENRSRAGDQLLAFHARRAVWLSRLKTKKISKDSK